MLRRSLSSDFSVKPSPHVRAVRSHSPLVVLQGALRTACVNPHPAVAVEAASFVDVTNVQMLYERLPYSALLILLLDVERVALRLGRRQANDQLAIADLAGWDWVVLLGPETLLRDASHHIDARLAGRVGCVVRADDSERQLAVQLECLAFRAPIGIGPNTPWLAGSDASLDQLPARTVLALRHLRGQPAKANVKLLAFVAGVSRRQLERQFNAAGLGSPSEFVSRIITTAL
jgi:AraC-like DNA-binding protein